MTELEQYIKSYFGVVSDQDLCNIVTLFKPKTIKKGEYLLKAGKRCDNMCFVQSGLLRMFISLKVNVVDQYNFKSLN